MKEYLVIRDDKHPQWVMFVRDYVKCHDVVNRFRGLDVILPASELADEFYVFSSIAEADRYQLMTATDDPTQPYEPAFMSMSWVMVTSLCGQYQTVPAAALEIVIQRGRWQLRGVIDQEKQHGLETCDFSGVMRIGANLNVHTIYHAGDAVFVDNDDSELYSIYRMAALRQLQKTQAVLVTEHGNEVEDDYDWYVELHRLSLEHGCPGPIQEIVVYGGEV